MLFAQKNNLTGLEKMCKFSSGEDFSVTLEFSHPGAASEEDKTWMFDLVRDNMKEMYIDARWGWDDGEKKRELLDEAARYIIARDGSGTPVAFAHYRLMVEGYHEVLYVYELQLVEGARRKGLGKRFMQLLELVALRETMKWVMLTVFTGNEAGMAFYTDKMKYVIDEISPSRNDVAREYTYEIMSKCMDPELRKVYTQAVGDKAIPGAGPTRRKAAEQLIAEAAQAALMAEGAALSTSTAAAAAAE